MFKIDSIKFKKINDKLKIKLRLLAQNSFLFFLAFFFVSLVLGFIIYYYFVFSVEISDRVIKQEELLRIDSKNQQRVLDKWQEKSDNFQKANTKEYSNPF